MDNNEKDDNRYLTLDLKRLIVFFVLAASGILAALFFIK
jgi:hypothetical protein